MMVKILPQLLAEQKTLFYLLKKFTDEQSSISSRGKLVQ